MLSNGYSWGSSLNANNKINAGPLLELQSAIAGDKFIVQLLPNSLPLNTSSCNSFIQELTLAICQPVSSAYFTLHTQPIANIVEISNPELKIYVKEQYNNNQVNLKIYDYQGAILSGYQVIEPLLYGENYMTIKLPIGLTGNKIYTLEVQDIKGGKQYLKFRIKV